MTDSIFQMSRIRFPLEKIIYKDAEYDETEIQLITEKEWKHIILFFGFIRKYKGLDLLIDALAELVKKDSTYKLLAAGEFYDDEKY